MTPTDHLLGIDVGSVAVAVAQKWFRETPMTNEERLQKLERENARMRRLLLVLALVPSPPFKLPFAVATPTVRVYVLPTSRYTVWRIDAPAFSTGSTLN